MGLQRIAAGTRSKQSGSQPVTAGWGSSPTHFIPHNFCSARDVPTQIILENPTYIFPWLKTSRRMSIRRFVHKALAGGPTSALLEQRCGMPTSEGTPRLWAGGKQSEAAFFNEQKQYQGGSPGGFDRGISQPFARGSQRVKTIFWNRYKNLYNFTVVKRASM